MNSILKKILSVSLAVSIALPYLGFVSMADTGNINQKPFETRGLVSNITKEISKQGPNLLDKNNKSEDKTIIKNKTLLNKTSKSWFDNIFEPAGAEELVSEKDGYKIEVADMNWIVGNKVSSELLRKDLTDDNPFHLRAKLNISLNSKKDYKPGDIKITVPRYIFKDRDGNDTGTLTLAVPKYPDSSQDFAYQEEGKNIVIVNTKRINATTQAFFEFTIKDLVPHKIKDLSTGYKSAPFSALVEATTDKDNKIFKKTGGVQAQINTRAVIDSVYTGPSQAYDVYPNSFPKELKPENDQDYVYVAWRAAATTTANQSYRMDVNSEFNYGPNTDGFKLLGYVKTDTETNSDLEGVKVVKSSDTSVTGIFDGFYQKDKNDIWNAGKHGYITYYVAYPRSNFKNGEEYQLSNYVTYKLTSQDDKEVTSKTKWDFVTYRPIKFVFPNGHFIVKKGTWSSDSYGLIRLKNGGDVSIRYNVSGTTYGYKWTYDDVSGLGPDDSSNYGHKKYTVNVRDFGVEFNTLKNLDDSDYSITSLEFNDFFIDNYIKSPEDRYGFVDGPNGLESRKVSQGEWAYVRDNNAELEVMVLGKIGDVWSEYCTYNTKTKVINPLNGASIGRYRGDDILVFPDNVKEIKLSYTTNKAGVTFSVVPTVKVKSSAKIKNFVENLYKTFSKSEGFVRNYADMNFVAGGENHFVNEIYIDQKINTFSYGSFLEKSATYSNDPAHKRLSINYKGLMTMQTNFHSTNDIEGVKNIGLYKEQTSAIWYDLLPKGVIPDTRSIKLRDGDTIDNVELIENYKDSGRILMKVYASLRPLYKMNNYNVPGDTILEEEGLVDKPSIEFKATYDWDVIPDWGKVLTNHMAYESLSGPLGNFNGYEGEPDDPRAGKNITTKNMDKTANDLLTDLNPKHDNPNFVYASTTNTLTADIYSSTFLKKTVSVGDENSYSDGQLNHSPKNVYENGFYTYKVRLRNADASSNDNIIFYDKLDGYVPSLDTDDYGDFRWRGKFVDVDLTELKKAGIKPIVYYSTKENIVVDNMDNRSDNDLTKSNIWTTTKPTDKRITAIAVDARHKTDGSDFELGVNKSISFTIKMQAPQLSKDDDAILDPELKTGDNLKEVYDGLIPVTETESGITGGAHAYNSTAMTFVSISNKDKVRTQNMLIKNEYTKVGLKKLDIRVEKSWDDDNDRDGLRSKTLSFDLFDSKIGYSKVNVLDSVTINKDSKWAGNFDKYTTPLDRSGNPINFEIKESSKPNGYIFSVTKDKTTDSLVFKAVNKHKPEKISLRGVKTWDHGPQPQKIRINLFANGNLLKSQDVVEMDGEWSYSFDDLYKYENGQPIKYTVTEDPVEGYEPLYNKDNINIHNKRFYERGDLRIFKTVKLPRGFIDSGGVLPEDRQSDDFRFKVVLKDSDDNLDNDEYDYVKPNGTNGKIRSGSYVYLRGGQSILIKGLKVGTTYEITELPEKYYKTEVSIINGTITKDNVSQANFVNIYNPLINLRGLKTWDESSQSLPFSIKVNLYGDGKFVKSKIVEELDFQWAYTFEDLPKYNDDGTLIKYTVKEDPVDGYTPVYDWDSINIHNKAVGYGSLKIEKNVKQSQAAILNGDPKPNNRDSDEFSFKVTLMRPDGQEDTRAYSYRKSNGYDYEIYSGQYIHLYKGQNAVIKDLPMGTKWKVVEDEHSKYVSEKVSLEGDIANKIESLAFFVNVYKDLITLSGVKTWDYSGGGILPFSIKVNLYGDGKFVKSKIVEEVDFEWSYTFEDLPKYNDSGKLIKYTVKEDPVEGYKPVYNKDNIDIYNKAKQGHALVISKKVIYENNQEIVGNSKVDKDLFTFTVLFKNSDGSVSNDSYTYEKSDGSQGQIRSGDTFILLNKESITIADLPNGTMYEVKEVPTQGYKPLVPKFTGQIENLDESIIFSNIYKPDFNIKVPLTGKKDIVFGLLLGSFLILVSSYYITIKRKI